MLRIPLWDQRVECRGKRRELGKCQPEGCVFAAEGFIRLIRRAHSFQIGREVVTIRLGQPKRFRLVEPVHDSRQCRQRSVVEIGCCIDGAEQRWGIQCTGTSAFIDLRD